MKAQASLATAAALFTSLASAVDYISIEGSNFINNSTGDRFDIIGVTYGHTPSPLSLLLRVGQGGGDGREANK